MPIAQSTLIMRLILTFHILYAIIALTSCGTQNIPYDEINKAPSYANTESNHKNDAKLKIVSLDVGEGDSTLIISPDGTAALIDAGLPNMGYDVVLPTMKMMNVKNLALIIATHYHADHIGGIAEVISGEDGILGTDDDMIPALGVFDRGDNPPPTNNAIVENYMDITHDIRHEALPEETFSIGDSKIRVITSSGRTPDKNILSLGDPMDENAACVSVILTRGTFRMFIGGDLTGGGGNPPYQTPDIESYIAPFIGDIDVLRISHHGSKTSTNEAFLDATTPEVAIISTGDGNQYGHPDKDVIKRILNRKIDILQTERGCLNIDGPTVANGDVEIDVNPDGSYNIK